MENIEINSSAQVIKELAQQQIERKFDFCSLERNVRNYVILPKGMDVREIPFLNAKAPFNCHTVIDANSFEKYVNCYANPTESRMFADIETLCLKAVIDYQPVSNSPSQAVDGYKNHIINFCLEKTEDFKAWESINNAVLDQQDFIQFLMERSHCVFDPDQATILEVARNLEINTNSNFSGQERISDGGINLVCREEIEAKVGNTTKIKVPDILTLKFSAFEGGSEMTLKARMFFKLNGGKVYFRIKILNLRETILKTFRETCDKIAENTKLDVHYVK